MKKRKLIKGIKIAAGILVVACNIFFVREAALFPVSVQAAGEEGYDLKYTLSSDEGDYAEELALTVSSTEDSSQIPVDSSVGGGARRLVYYALYKPNAAVSESAAVTTVEQESELYSSAKLLLDGFTTYKASSPEADAGIAYEAYQEFLGIMDGRITDDASLQYNVSGSTIQDYRNFCAGNKDKYARFYTAIACLDSYFKTLQNAGCVVENAYGVSSFPLTMENYGCSETADLTLGLDDDELCADYYLFVWDKVKSSADDTETQPSKSVYHYVIKTAPDLTYSEATPLVYTGSDLTEILLERFSATDKLSNNVTGTYTFEITNEAGETVSELKDSGLYNVSEVTFTADDTATYVATTYPAFSVEIAMQEQAALSIDSIGTKTYEDSSFVLSTNGGSGSGAVSFESSDPSIVSISGTTATIHNAGTVTITAVKAADNNYYQATATADLTVGRRSVADAVISGITDMNYDEDEIEQLELSVTVNGKTLIYNTDYEVGYQNNTDIGTATVIITGQGNYTGTIEKNFQINVIKGTTYKVSNKKYKITNTKTDGTGTVTLTGSTKSKTALKGTLSIGNTVNIGGKSFKITAIGDKAFKGYTKLTKVTIGKNVAKIGKEAFSGCSKVTSVTISTGLKTISTKAFYNCKKLKTITISSKQLKTVQKNAIKNINSSAVIKVPSAKVKAYKKLFKSSTGFTNAMQVKKK